MNKQNIWTIVCLSIFGSMTLFGSTVMAFPGSEEAPLDEAPTREVPPQASQEVPGSESKPEEPVSGQAPTDSVPEQKNQPDQRKIDQPVEPESQEPKTDQSTDVPDRSHADDAPAGKQEEYTSSGSNQKKEESSHHPESPPSTSEDFQDDVVLAQGGKGENDDQDSSVTSSDHSSPGKGDEKEAPKTESDEMVKTGSETLPLLMLSFGIFGMVATLAVRFRKQVVGVFTN
ncbi:hypothetical protein GCM10007416_34400 [Kroppenstedtia guangzhouensis]|uniref:Uncharacterized protein n=1 Tax=Kroppenstedtia guangzhouensis TaxID=1274356 RepID=A0ABQ1H5R4_9BACL|nr:hypothetical protein [Kroppenstedtia guangzhouensis]GGA58322.1 hypothetical protein GCM10007416_34400 [Kroppenstedtia guangzhouensis]